MKKIFLIIFSAIALSSCDNSAHLGDADKTIWIIDDAEIMSVRGRRTRYEIRGLQDGTYKTCCIEFTDETGKYNVGDTVKIVKIN